MQVAGDAVELGVEDSIYTIGVEFPRRGGPDDANRERANSRGDVVSESVRRKDKVTSGDNGDKILYASVASDTEDVRVNSRDRFVLGGGIPGAYQQNGGCRLGDANLMGENADMSRLPSFLEEPVAGTGVDANPTIRPRRELV